MGNVEHLCELLKTAQGPMGPMGPGAPSIDPSLVVGGPPSPPPEPPPEAAPQQSGLSDEDIKKIVDGVARALSEGGKPAPASGDKGKEVDDTAAIRSDIAQLKDQMAQLMGVIEPLVTALMAPPAPPAGPMPPDMAAMGAPPPGAMPPGAMPPAGAPPPEAAMGGAPPPLPMADEAGIPLQA